MSACTLRLTRNTPLRTVLVDEATGEAKYQIDTPMRLTRSVTRIRKFDPPTRHPLRWDDGEFDPVDITDKGRKKKKKTSGGDITNVGVKKSKKEVKKGVKKPKKDKKVKEDKEDKGEDKGEEGAGSAETNDEAARIYWRWFSSDRIIFRGKARLRTEFLPRCGKMKGYANPRRNFSTGNRVESVSDARSYMFTGPDGVQYKWAMGPCGMNLPKASIPSVPPPCSRLNQIVKLVSTDGEKTVIAEFHRARHLIKPRKARLEVQPAGMEMLDYIVLTFVFAETKRRQREAAAKTAGG